MNRSDVAAAARLLRYAVITTNRPTPGSDYRALLDRYRTDTDFAEGVLAVTEGLSMYVIFSGAADCSVQPE